MPVRLNQMGESGEIPCIFPRNRETACRDTFADDCLHRQLVRCFSRESSLSEIIAKVPRLSLAKVGASGPRERRLEKLTPWHAKFSVGRFCGPVTFAGHTPPDARMAA